jgi:hypothetical protein
LIIKALAAESVEDGPKMAVWYPTACNIFDTVGWLPSKKP